VRIFPSVPLNLFTDTFSAIIPYLAPFYNVSYTVVSLVFLSPLVGYIAAAGLNNFLHKTLGQRGVAIIGPSAHLVAYIIICLHPPYPVLVIVFILAGFGNGILDAAWNAWIGNLANPNEVLGFLHAFYGAGAVVSPLIATALITRAGLGWYTFYYFMVGVTIENSDQAC
jgi:fucose permease